MEKIIKNNIYGNKKILVVDAHGGGVGKEVVSELKKKYSNQEIIAVGTNYKATEAMKKAGADIVATGENAIKVNAKKVDIIIAPIGMVIADSLNGEVSPLIALSLSQSDAIKILIPFNHCDNIIVGVNNLSIKYLIDELVKEVDNLL